MRKFIFCAFGILFALQSHAATLPAGYTELEYIESTGTQWIDTGINQARFVHDIAFTTKNNKNLMGNSASAGWYWGQERSSNDDGYELASKHIYTNSRERRIVEYNNINQHNITLTANGRTVSHDTDTIIYTNYVLFRIYDSNTYYTNSKLYKFQAYNANDVLVRDMIPAKNASGVVGMYDMVSDQFFTNQGTGDFVAGPTVTIKIATTKYTEDAFAGLVATLNSAIDKVTNIVDDTVQQATEIGVLAETKQDRPDTDCPAGRKCLLIMGADNKPHWYLIQE